MSGETFPEILNGAHSLYNMFFLILGYGCFIYLLFAIPLKRLGYNDRKLSRRTHATLQRLVYAQSYAYSDNCNSGGWEYYWYPLWNQVLVELVGDDPNLLVSPQYPVWILKNNSTSAGHNHQRGGRRILINEHHRRGNTMPPTINATTPKTTQTKTPKAKYESDVILRTPDYAVIRVTTSANANLPSCYQGYEVEKELIPLIAKIKDPDNKKDKLNEAQHDLAFQAALLFRRYRDINSVMVIAACGPCWSNTTFTRSNIRLSQDAFGEGIKNRKHSVIAQEFKFGDWSDSIQLSAPSSVTRLNKISHKIRQQTQGFPAGNLY